MSRLRYALRQLTGRPGLSAVVVVMLALGLGGTTAMFSVFYEITQRPLPVADPQALVNLGAPGLKWGSVGCSMAGDCEQIFSYPMFRDLEARQTAFAGIAGHSFFDANLSFHGLTLPGEGALVSSQYFSLLGLRPALGRLLGPQDDIGGGRTPVVVLSYGYWRDYLGADPSVVGQALLVNGQLLTIVGVAPGGFFGTTFGKSPRVFVPLSNAVANSAERATDRRGYWIYAFARLAPGGSLERARVSINALYGAILNEVEAPTLSGIASPDELEQFRRREITLAPGALGQSWLRPAMASTTQFLVAITALVLLIACANIANLLFARGAARAGELAVRAAIGASRGRLLAQLLLESTLLAIPGLLASLPVAWLTLRTIVALAPPDATRSAAPELDATALLFAGAAGLATVVVFGVFPAIRASRTDPGAVMKGHAAQAVGGRGAAGFRASLATAQIALSTVLLVLAGWFAHGLAQIARIELGIDVDSVVSFRVAPKSNGYTPERSAALFDRIEAELAALPGVTRVGSSTVRLLVGNVASSYLNIEGFEDRGMKDAPSALFNRVSPGFLQALSVPLRSGRDFTDADRAGAPRVAIVNEEFVRKYGLGDAPVGKRFGGGDLGTERNIEIVGVAADAAYFDVKADIEPQYYLPRRQEPSIGALTFYVRAAVEPESLLETVPRVIASIDPDLPVDELETLRRTVRNSTSLDRLIAILSAAFAGLATLLTAIGLYGVLAYSVARRTRELGLRVALGAAPRALRAMVARQAAWMTSVGLAAGLAAALGIGRAAGALIYGLEDYDPAVLAAAAAMLCAVVALAAYVPARRAARVAPMEALRHE